MTSNFVNVGQVFISIMNFNLQYLVLDSLSIADIRMIRWNLVHSHALLCGSVSAFLDDDFSVDVNNLTSDVEKIDMRCQAFAPSQNLTC